VFHKCSRQITQKSDLLKDVDFEPFAGNRNDVFNVFKDEQPNFVGLFGRVHDERDEVLAQVSRVQLDFDHESVESAIESSDSGPDLRIECSQVLSVLSADPIGVRTIFD
jgi:hypothetical protein